MVLRGYLLAYESIEGFKPRFEIGDKAVLELRVNQLGAHQPLQGRGVGQRRTQVGLQQTESALHTLHGVILASMGRGTPQFVKQFLDSLQIAGVEFTGRGIVVQRGGRYFVHLLEHQRADLFSGVGQAMQPYGLHRGLLPKITPDRGQPAGDNNQSQKGQLVDEQQAAQRLRASRGHHGIIGMGYHGHIRRLSARSPLRRWEIKPMTWTPIKTISAVEHNTCSSVNSSLSGASPRPQLGNGRPNQRVA